MHVSTVTLMMFGMRSSNVVPILSSLIPRFVLKNFKNDNQRIKQTGFSNLMKACDSGNEDVVQYLCELESMTTEYINTALVDSGCTALWKACYHGFAGITWLLLEHGAEPNLRDHVCFVCYSLICVFVFFL